VFGKEFKQVVQKPNAGTDIGFPRTIDIEFERNLRLPRFADNFSFPFHTVFVAITTSPSNSVLKCVAEFANSAMPKSAPSEARC
jgi:hypothetical protein